MFGIFLRSFTERWTADLESNKRWYFQNDCSSFLIENVLFIFVSFVCRSTFTSGLFSFAWINQKMMSKWRTFLLLFLSLTNRENENERQSRYLLCIVVPLFMTKIILMFGTDGFTFERKLRIKKLLSEDLNERCFALWSYLVQLAFSLT